MTPRTELRSRVLERIARDVVDACGRPEINRTYVAGATVERDGSHFWIAAGSDSKVELDQLLGRLEGRCSCGGPLSISFRRSYCRRCQR